MQEMAKRHIENKYQNDRKKFVIMNTYYKCKWIKLVSNQKRDGTVDKKS